MTVGLAATTANAFLNALFNQANYTADAGVWIQLHTGDPGSAGTANVATNSTRKDVTNCFPNASAGSVANDVLATWTSVPASEDYSHCSFWSASSTGTFRLSAVITANAVSSGDTFTLAVSAVTVTLGAVAA